MKFLLLRWQWALLLVVVVIAVSGYAAKDLRLNNAPQVYYSPNSPAVVLREKLRSHFPTDELMTVVFEGKDLYTA
jgi:predicted RND superfamily exporter protein